MKRYRLRIVLFRLAATLALVLAMGAPAAGAAPLAAPGLAVSPGEGTVGMPTTITGQGPPTAADVELLWETATGSVGAQGNMYTGRKLEPRTDLLAVVRAGQDGSFTHRMEVPRDFGGIRTIVAQAAGRSLAQTGFRLWPKLDISTLEGPAGTPIRLRGEGFGIGLTDSQFHVIYDNRYMGLFSGVATKGSVDFTIPAAGNPGLHRIDVYANSYGPAYLNLKDGGEMFKEYSQVPRWHWNFTVTPGQAPKDPVMESGRFVSTKVAGPVPELPAGPSLDLSSAQGPVGTKLTVSAAGFQSGEKVDLVWQSLEGAYIQAGGFNFIEKVLATGTAGGDGRARLDIVVPSDAGGWHPVYLRAASQSASGLFGVVRAITMSPLSGPPGTEIHVKLTGVGWRSWENNAAFTWNNAFTGYACALNEEKGTINVFLTAVGDPGRHMIGLWPAIFRGPASVNYGGDQPDNQRMPVLAPHDLPEYIEPVTFAFTIEGTTPFQGQVGTGATSAFWGNSTSQPSAGALQSAAPAPWQLPPGLQLVGLVGAAFGLGLVAASGYWVTWARRRVE
jgi:hypothetical protein